MVVFLGRSGPVEPASLVQPASRKSSTPPFQWISSAFTALDPYGFRLLDLETGRLGSFSLPFEHGIDLVAVSPWVEGGHRQIVGLGWKQSGNWGSAERGDVGILRLSLPEGEILNWIPVADSLPASQLRWVPGATAAVVYAACDGQVYRIDFEQCSADGHIEQLPEPKTCQLTWQTPMPSAAGVLVEDIDYPGDPRLGGKILVSLRSMNAGTRHYGHSQIWWLQPDKDGTSIVAAGRLLEPAAETEPSDRRLPSLAGGAQNSTALLYFARVAGQPDYQLTRRSPSIRRCSRYSSSPRGRIANRGDGLFADFRGLAERPVALCRAAKRRHAQHRAACALARNDAADGPGERDAVAKLRACDQAGRMALP